MNEGSRLPAPDAVREVWLDLRARPGRSALTSLGTLIGIAVLVSTLGLAASLNAQIAGRFDALTATEVTAKSVETEGSENNAVPADAVDRVLRIRGTVAAAMLSELTDITQVTGTPGYDPTTTTNEGISVFAGSPGLVDIVHGDVTGTFFNDWHNTTNQPVAVLGRGAADRLHIDNLAARPVVFIDDRPVVVIGILETAARHTILLQNVIVPEGYAEASLGLAGPQSLLVETDIGATQVVADQIGLAIRPDNPDRVQTVVPPSPELTRRLIAGDTQTLFVVLGLISLVIGGVGIANMTLVSVLERTTEIGLRRAVGARRRHIVTQFLLSSVTTALLGAIAGTGLGLVVTTAVALLQQWPPTMPTWVPLFAPFIGADIGLVAGLYPARRASRIEPIDALRVSG